MQFGHPMINLALVERRVNGIKFAGFYLNGIRNSFGLSYRGSTKLARALQ